jgi:uncharacterized protein (TIGR02646 family)
MHVWGDLVTEDRTAIWASLEEMQRGLCAYCEGSLQQLGRHIEHLCPRSRVPERTFDWSNLFGSCDRSDCCGHFKDRRRAPQYDCRDLIDPTQEDPDHFFVIRDSGRIELKRDLAAEAARRADLTIRVFNLNLDGQRGGRSLRAERARVLRFYLALDPGVLEAIVEFSPSERLAYVNAEIEAANEMPFGSILRHFFRQAA